MAKSWLALKSIINQRNIFADVALGRFACVGERVLRAKIDASHNNLRFFNIQKGRLDLLLDWIDGKDRPKAKLIKPYIANQGVYGLIKQQQKFNWLKHKKFNYLFMDTWSELGDQKFTHKKEGWSFCCNFPDINYQSDFKEKFSFHGLLSEEEILKSYELFFNWFKVTHPGKQIFIMYYSPKFDRREKFKERVTVINNSIAELTNNYNFIINLRLEDDQVYLPDYFNYHYSDVTIKSYVDKWAQVEKNKE